MTALEDLAGIAELAAALEVKPNTIVQWRRRHSDFPAPVVTLGGAPIWLRSDVEKWHVARKDVEPSAVPETATSPERTPRDAKTAKLIARHNRQRERINELLAPYPPLVEAIAAEATKRKN